MIFGRTLKLKLTLRLSYLAMLMALKSSPEGLLLKSELTLKLS